MYTCSYQYLINIKIHLYSVIKIIINKQKYLHILKKKKNIVTTLMLTVVPDGITIDICMQLIVRINIYLKIINMKLFHISRLFYESRSE